MGARPGVAAVRERRAGRAGQSGFLRAVLLAGLAAWLVSGSALAQAPLIPGLPAATQGKAAKSAGDNPAPDDAALAAELRARLAAERKLLAVLDGPNGLGAGAPPGTELRALKQRHIRVAFMVSTLVQHLADLDKLDETLKRRADAEKDLKAWSGLAEKPPYSILLADRLRAERHAAATELEGLRGRQELLKQTTDDLRERLKAARQQLRQATEKAERARSESEQVQQAWERENAGLVVRLMETALGHQDTLRRLIDAEIGIAQSGLDLAQRKLEQAAAATHFTEADLAQVRATLTAERDALVAETERMAQEYPRLHEATRIARAASEALRAGGGRKGETQAQYLARLGRLEQELELKQARLDAAAGRIERLRDGLALNRTRSVLWEARYDGLGKQDSRGRQLARDAAEKMQVFLSAQKKQMEQIYKSAGNRVSDIDLRMENAELPALNSHLRELQKVYGEHTVDIQRTLAALDANLGLAQQMLVEFGGGNNSQRSWAERRAEWSSIAGGYAAAIWNFELIAVEDTIEVDGKPVVGTRSVTIGKVLVALLLILAGYALALFAARLLARLLVRYFGWQPAHAGILRSWVLAVELMLLVAIVMFWVKIPLTVFAFLGGAVAIGLGFGMQTMMKNLISGLMVLGERPFRIGDLVEVGGIRGNVTNIGLRASTITDVNGIETIIPNSTFIEQNLTNWTYTSGRVRFNVKVGVAYGSPVRTVTQLLEEIAGRHGKVLKNPAPEVLLEDFGGDALVFSLYYWLDVRSGTPARQVASDLRAMIEAGFAAQGIAIPFPQRDVHLDATNPVPVRVVPAAEAPPSPPPPLP
ncbi:MAG: mechanosensitive ion channel [Sulfuritalea sp.]|nr:mechanosensitive ion channel [Sulfuritalea sp.]